jgi:dipeptidase D
MSEVRNLQPNDVWNHFEDLNAVPRASKKEEQVIQFMVDFGNGLGLSTYRDPIGNVIIKKPATPGKEKSPTVILQAHIDMVHQKNNDTVFDFATQGIQTWVDGDWVRAKGTTLGADNGLGVSMIMAVIAAKDIAHPALEALFTIDEETGMTGAKELEQGILEGKILLNIDTEEDDEFTIGCAGGIDTTIEWKYDLDAEGNGKGYRLTVKGLVGGHSGTDIHLQRGNANKIMARLLQHAPIRLVRMEGGSLRNAIPREAVADFYTDETNFQSFKKQLERLVSEIKVELASVDPNFDVHLEEINLAGKSMSPLHQKQFINALMASFNGVFRMSPDIADLVEASNNVARVEVGEGSARVLTLQRSSVESSKEDVANTVAAPWHVLGASVTHSGSYPGWKPNPNSTILTVMVDRYRSLFGTEPKVLACHAGLECGILGERYPGLDMISFGPTIRGAHSPDERASVSSLQKSHSFFLNVLAQL